MVSRSTRCRGLARRLPISHCALVWVSTHEQCPLTVRRRRDRFVTRQGPSREYREHFAHVADMMANGVYVVDGDSFTEIGFIPTGVGTHGLCVSRDGRKLYASNRGSHTAFRPHGKGSIAVINFATRR